MSTAASRASALHKLFQNADKTVAGSPSAWEKVLLGSAQHVSTPLAARLLGQMGLGRETGGAVRVFENACGVGVVAPLLQQTLAPEVLGQSRIVCGDFSEQVVGLVRGRAEREGWVNTEAERVDAQKMRFDDGAFTHVATNIGFHVVPDSEAALDEAIRVLEPGGVLGFSTWHKQSGWMEQVKEAFKTFPFEAPCEMELQTTTWGDWSDVNWIRKTLVDKGLHDVKVEVVAYLTQVEGPADFIEKYAMMIDWVMGSGWSEEQKKAHPREEVQALIKEFFEQDPRYGSSGWEMSWVGVLASGCVSSEACGVEV
ncbi:S-adenosyl-L-methionine-dependent methyltransferase [Trichocladium antarcticum]|uniref:S-adenosyl-L-methionine-dependent methyltransferase n=1 Tax=Trichocladium antarcticum TaxID=1450529 RepID=A0AAN6ZE59_9PEZI|nr:S-adenosyl-L-methionine-dependent methyltransferase [Trichocladium antarcticum]